MKKLNLTRVVAFSIHSWLNLVSYCGGGSRISSISLVNESIPDSAFHFKMFLD